jgi:hypothetical protein
VSSLHSHPHPFAHALLLRQIACMGTLCCRCLCVLTSLSSAPIRTRTPIGAASSLGDTVLLICSHSHTRAGDTHVVGVCFSTSQHFCSHVLTPIPNIARCTLLADRSVPRQPHSRQRAGLPRCAARREEPRTLHSTPQRCVATAHAGTAHSSTASVNLRCIFCIRFALCCMPD